MAGEFRVKNGILVGTESADASALLNLTSTTKGALFPRMTEAQRDAIGTPATGLVVYNTDTNKLNVYDGSAWTAVGAGGAGGINYVTNYDLESNTDGYTAYADAAQATPENGTGGSPSHISISQETTAANVIRGAASLKITNSGSSSAQGEGVSYDITIDEADQGKALTFSFEYYTSSGYASDEVECFVYDVTNTTVINVNATEDFDGTVKATGSADPADTRKFIGQFYAASDSTSYRIIWHVAGTGTAAWTMHVDNVRVGPESFYNMPIVSKAEAVTMTVSTGSGAMTNYSVTAYEQRLGNRAIYEGVVTFSGAPGTWSDVNIVLPTGRTIDTDALAADAANGWVGEAQLLDSGTAAYTAKILYVGTTSLRIQYEYTDTFTGNAPQKVGDFSSTVPFTWASGDKIFFTFDVPISEWASTSTQMSTTQASLLSARAAYTTTAGQSISSGAAAAIIDFGTLVKDTHLAVTTGASWKYTAPTKQVVTVDVRATLSSSAAWNEGETAALYLYKNGALFRFLDFIYAPFTGAQIMLMQGSCTVELASGDYIDIRIVQNSGSAITMDTTAGINTVEITSVPDITAIGVYSPYEVVSSTSSSLGSTGLSAATWGDLTSIALTPGTWQISALVSFGNNGAVTAGSVNIGIGSASGTGTTGVAFGTTRAIAYNEGTTGYYYTLSLPGAIETVTSSTTRYLKAYFTGVTNLEAAWNITARRLK